MIRKVTQSACGSPGSLSTARQLVSPAGWIAPRPSHGVKLSASTPISGITPKAMKMTRAGSAIQATGPLPPGRGVATVPAPRGAAGGATVVTCR